MRCNNSLLNHHLQALWVSYDLDYGPCCAVFSVYYYQVIPVMHETVRRKQILIYFIYIFHHLHNYAGC